MNWSILGMIMGVLGLSMGAALTFAPIMSDEENPHARGIMISLFSLIVLVLSCIRYWA